MRAASSWASAQQRSMRAASPWWPRAWRVTAILRTSGRRVVLADGTELPYKDVVVATGASARPSPWRPESGLHVLRSLADVVLEKFGGDSIAETRRNLGSYLAAAGEQF